MDAPPLITATVIEKSGWHPTYAEVLAIVTDGAFGFTLVDGNGDRADLEEEIWMVEDGEWRPESSGGVFGPDYEDPANRWSAGGGFGDGVSSCRYEWGFGRGHRSVELQFESATYHVPALGNGFWAFLTTAHRHDESPKVSLRP